MCAMWRTGERSSECKDGMNERTNILPTDPHPRCRGSRQGSRAAATPTERDPLIKHRETHTPKRGERGVQKQHVLENVL